MSVTDGQAGFDGEQLNTWATLATVLEWLPAELDAQLQRDSDLTHFEYGILFALAHAETHTLRMSTLAKHSNSSLSRLSRAVTRLERKAWMRRETDATDGRYTLAILTDAGSQVVHDATPGHVQTVTRLVFDPLTAGQTRQLEKISRRILRAIRPDEGWTPASTV